MKVIDLRPDSKLLKTNFDSYKLSLDPIPVLKNEVISKPLRIKLTSDQYSLNQTTLFSLQNHLIADPWLSYTYYYVTSEYAIEKIVYDLNTGRLNNKPRIVYKFQPDRERIEDIYNAELKFISEKYALLSDGTGNLQLIDTADRQKGEEWKEVEIFQPLASSDNSFILQDAKFKIEKSEKVIHCLLLHIEQIEEKFLNIINWISLKEDASSKKWQCVDRRTIQGKGSLFYLSLDVHCQALIYSSNHAYKFTLDSVNEIIEEIPREEIAPEKVQNEATIHKFQWTQKGEDITINFNAISGATKTDYNIKCLQSHVEIKCIDEVLISSDIFAEIDVDLTTWTIENDFLQLNLVKKQSELIWPYLIPSGPFESEGNSQNFNSQPVADLNAQMEECDFGDNEQGNNEYFIERLEVTTHQASHKIFLNCNHPLFTITLRPGFPKALAIRNDVDCCCWLQNHVQPSNDDWNLKHEGTLHAFGYVQASKKDRKYLSCSPDMNIAVISESVRHLFIYKKSYSSAPGLRKRIGPQLQIGQQKLVALDGSHGEILGLHVENEVIMLLTENSILCLQLSEEE